ncbi:glycerol-3-phosphate dehydrogenase subunit GlpB [Aestuariimicrobium sp. p3-SID1156]|uniref:glycerol-3-phosphate dehydrogenase subunit GlpB n=1 Tax=Aestuariimicrobium sp. p3-SID1156 TaxID=2916038 RepID=UPI00223ABB8C|nr:glycerol-3-phosphate dehydrogenase subunit GlpB [Aestuariimicrobium sp. p3-SID1156]MCT1459314.1 glycerol-3-phosphate dehydrogenase subunit GlpB [Aestuariimicrobium sp. p3-SID1156]
MTSHTAPIADSSLATSAQRSAAERVVVVGSGIAGLTAALTLARAGKPVTLVTKGIGGLQLSQGTIDVLGSRDGNYVPFAFDAFDGLPDSHPYRLIGKDAVLSGVETFARELGEGYFEGQAGVNALYPTAVGALRPTALVPASMAAGRAEVGRRMVIVGVRELKDYHPELIAGNLARTALPEGDPMDVRAASISLPAREGEVDSNPVMYARSMDRPEFRARFIAEVKKVIQPGEVVGVPAVLGLNDPTVHAEVEKGLGAEVFEIVSQPPCVPGMRMNQHLTVRLKELGVRIVLGAEVVGLQAHEGRVTGVDVRTAGRVRTLAAEAVIHCGGGFESGALAVDSHNRVSETLFDLPITATDATELIHGDYWGAPQPLFEVGVRVDEAMRILDAEGHPVYPNLFAAGGILAGAIRWHEKSGEGIALGSAHKAARTICEGDLS